MSTTAALLTSVLLLVLNGFFVAAEFAIVASKRHRLEEAAESGSRAAKSAVSAHREMSLMLAGAQLGITLCTLGLGALSEPALASLLEPLLHSIGLPDGLNHVIAVVIAVSLVVFLHMVVGEMAPKSWAISHPEPSALMGHSPPTVRAQWLRQSASAAGPGRTDRLRRLGDPRTGRSTVAAGYVA